MEIKILGSGCSNCQKLELNTKEAIKEMKVEAKIEKITDFSEIMSFGVMGMPALVVNEKVLVSGRVPNASEIKAILSNL